MGGSWDTILKMIDTDRIGTGYLEGYFRFLF